MQIIFKKRDWLSLKRVLTVCGGHPFSIVGKSGQRHIKVRDYLRKYGN